jgi:hypothetical protein
MKRILLALFVGSVSFAQSAPQSPEALAACSGRAEYAGCTVTLEDGAHAGVCITSQRDRASTCMPKPVPMPPAPSDPSSWSAAQTLPADAALQTAARSTPGAAPPPVASR